MSKAVHAGIRADKSRSSLPVRTAPLERARLEKPAGSAARGADRSTLEHRFGRVRVHETLAPVAQPNLKMGTPGDKYEREADRVADELTHAAVEPTEAPALSSVRTSALRQRTSGVASPITPAIQSRIERLQRGGGEPLPKQVRAAIEPRLGHDLDGVRIHRNSAAHDVARDLRARALTVGDHIVFNRGQYPAGNEANSRLLTHELAHTVQQHGTHPIIQRVPMVIDAGAPEGGLQLAPAEDLIEPGSDLDRQFNSLSLSIRQLLHSIFGEAGAPAEEIWAELFPKGQFSEARTAAESYRSVTNELSTRKLDVAFAAQWLDMAISTMSTVGAALNQIANSGTTQASMAKTLSRQARRILNAAKRLRKNQKIARGSALAAGARASTVKRLRREHGEAQHQKRRERRPDLLQMAHASHLELLKMKFEAERSDPEFVETLNKELEVTEAIEEGRITSHETPLAALQDRLGTIERSSREDAARLIARMDQVDLTRLAGQDSERVGDLGLRLAESTPSQTAIGLAGTPLPFIGPAVADIVSERFEEKQAVHDLASAIVAAGGPSEPILVPDLDRLTDLEITRIPQLSDTVNGDRRGDLIRFRKSDRLHSLELLDESRAGSSRIPRRIWTFSPSELVTLTVVGSGQSATLPAFAWLHAEDVGLEATYQEWASLAQQGAAVARASIKAASSKAAAQASGFPPVKSPSSAPPRVGSGPPRAARSVSGGGRGDEFDDLFAAGETGGFKAAGPLVNVPSRREPRQLPETARVLEIGANRPRTKLGIPEQRGLLAVARTDKKGTAAPSLDSAELQSLDANEPIPDEFIGKFDTVIINNPHGFVPDIAKLGKALRPNGRIIVQGRGRIPTIGKKKQKYNHYFQELLEKPAPPGYELLDEEAGTLLPTRRTEPQSNILGEDFRYTTGEEMPGTGPNARLVYIKTGG